MREVTNLTGGSEPNALAKSSERLEEFDPFTAFVIEPLLNVRSVRLRVVKLFIFYLGNNNLRKCLVLLTLPSSGLFGLVFINKRAYLLEPFYLAYHTAAVRHRFHFILLGPGSRFDPCRL